MAALCTPGSRADLLDDPFDVCRRAASSSRYFCGDSGRFTTSRFDGLKPGDTRTRLEKLRSRRPAPISSTSASPTSSDDERGADLSLADAAGAAATLFVQRIPDRLLRHLQCRAPGRRRRRSPARARCEEHHRPVQRDVLHPRNAAHRGAGQQRDRPRGNDQPGRAADA